MMLTVPTSCPPVRLVGGNSENEGRLEIYYNNTWGTVCDNNWGLTDSNTACRQLGYARATAYYRSMSFIDTNVPVWMDRVSCGTYDLCLGKCSFSGFGNNYCRHLQDVFLNCTGTRDTNKLGNKSNS